MISKDLQTDNIPSVKSPYLIQSAGFTSEDFEFDELQSRGNLLCRLLSVTNGEIFFEATLENYVPFQEDSPKPFYPQVTLKVSSILNEVSCKEELRLIDESRKTIGRVARPDGE